MTRRERFLAEARGRLEVLTPGTAAYAAELSALEAEMHARIDEESAEYRRSQESLIAQQREQYIEARRTYEAQRLLEPLVRDGALGPLLPFMRQHVRVERRGDAWEVALEVDGKSVTEAELLQHFRETPAYQPALAGFAPHEVAAHGRKVAEMLGEAVH